MKDDRGGNMLIPDEMYNINEQDLENIRKIIKRSNGFIEALEKANPFSWELKWENEYLITLQKIEILLEQNFTNNN